jgi:hypothetical protein
VAPGPRAASEPRLIAAPYTRPVLLVHVVNPFLAPAGSKPQRMQAVTWEAIRRALHGAAMAPGLRVELLAAVFPQDRPAAARAHAAVELSRSLLDATDIRPARMLPLIGEILGRASEHALERDAGAWVVYTNMDICPQPYFYELVARLASESGAIGGGNGSNGSAGAGFAVTRRNVDERTLDPSDVSLMAADVGERSYGLDTFAFPARAGLGFALHDVAVGLPFIDEAVMGNIDAAGGFRGRVHKQLHATFHLGNDLDWKRNEALCEFNRRQAAACFRTLVERHPGFPAGSHFDRMQGTILERTPRCKTPWGRVRQSLGIDRRGR